MALINEKGKHLNEDDMKSMKEVLLALLDSYKKTLEELKEYASNSGFFDNLIQTMEEHKKKVLEDLTNAANQPEDVTIESFYNNTMYELCLKMEEKKVAAELSNLDAELLNRNFRNQFIERYDANSKMKYKDTANGLKTSMASFKLAKKPFEHIENIAFCDPRTTSVDPLSIVRKANSNTYDAQQGLDTDEAKVAKAGFNGATEYVRSSASKLMNKTQLGFGDLYEIFSTINQCCRADYDKGGRIRGEEATTGDIEGISSLSIPMHVYHMMDQLADHINQVKQTKDLSLKKTQAIQVAAFAYQMLVSEHVFADGNGRTCRMFADTILQSFGLPPHTPNIALTATGATIGKHMDFEHGAKLFYDGVSASNEILCLESNKELEGEAAQAKRLLTAERINPDVALKATYKEAVSFAVQNRLNKASLIEACDDFIHADHLFAANSGEYDDVVRTAKAVKKALATEPIASERMKKRLQILQKYVDAYLAYTNTNVRKDSTRRARINAAERISDAILYSENTINQIEKKAGSVLLDRIGQMQNNLTLEMNEKIDTTDTLKKYIVTAIVARDIKKEKPYMATDTMEKCLTFDEKALSAIDGDRLDTACKKAQADPTFASKTVSEQLQAISSLYIEISRNEMKADPEVAEKTNAVNTNAVPNEVAVPMK